MLPVFVTNKRFVYVILIRLQSDVLQTVKQFAKEVGALDAFIADMLGEQMFCEIWQFYSNIGMALRALEEGTPWSNKAELYND